MCYMLQFEWGMELRYYARSFGPHIRPQMFGHLQPENVGQHYWQKTNLLEVWRDWLPLLFLSREIVLWSSCRRQAKFPICSILISPQRQ